MNRKQLIAAYALIALFIPTSCYSGDSGLRDIVDSQGNMYSAGEDGMIYSDGLPHPNRQPASVENLGYYFNQAGMLEVNGHLGDAMDMYYEIMCLPDVNEDVVRAKYAIGLRMERLYNDDLWKSVVLVFFDVTTSDDGEFKIFPRRIRRMSKSTIIKSGNKGFIYKKVKPDGEIDPY